MRSRSRKGKVLSSKGLLIIESIEAFTYFICASVFSIYISNKISKYHFKKVLYLFDSLNSLEKSYLELFKQLLNEFEKINKSQLNLIVDDYRYKHYSVLIKKILFAAKSYGFNHKPALKKLRSNLFNDFKFTRKIKMVFFNGFFQFFILTILTWIFLSLSSIMIEFDISFVTLVQILSLQISGIIFFSIGLYILGIYKLSFLEEVEVSLLDLKVSFEINLPLGEIIKKSKVNKLIEKGEGKYIILLRIKQVIFNVIHHGDFSTSEFNEIIQDLINLKEEALLALIRAALVLRLVILLAFYLSSYFIAIYSISSQLLK